IERWNDLLEEQEDPALCESLREGLIGLLERKKRRAIRAGDEAEERALDLRIAGLLHQANPDRALALYAAVLDARPSDVDAREGLLALWRDGVADRDATWDALDRALARGGDHATRLALREEILERTVEIPARHRILLELRTIAEESLGDPGRAFDAAARAFVEGSDEAGTQLERLARAAGRLEALCELLEVEAAKREGREARELRARAAAIYERELGDTASAAQRYAAILTSDPADAEALEALERLYRAMGRHRELVALYEQRLGLEPTPEEGRRILLSLAAVQLDALGDETAAIEAYRRVLETDPDDREAFPALADLLRSAHRHGELAELYEMRLARGAAKKDPRVRAELQVELAEALLGAKRDKEAFDRLRAVLAESPRHLGALGLLEKLVVEEEGSRKVEAARLLAPIFLDGREFGRAVPLLEILAAAAPEPAERARIYLQIADVHATAMPQPALAFVAASRALRSHPDSEPALDAVL